MKNKKQSILSIVFSLIAASGCGDYVTKPDFESADASRQAEIVALQARIDTLEAVFVSDVILNTETRTESGKWPKFDGTIDLDATWRFLEAGSTRVNGGYTITWTNNTNSDITVNYSLVFSDASGIQLGEYDPFDDFALDAGENRKRTGNFNFTASVARANQVKSMDIWAGFTER